MLTEGFTMEPIDKLKLENQLCFPLYAASRMVVRQYRPYLDALDLTYTQYIVMMVLWAENKISVKELGEKLYLDSGTLTPVLKSMEKKGFLRRYRSSEDERVLIAELTEKGKALQAGAASVPEKMASCIKLEQQEAGELYTLLYKILKMLQAEQN